MLAAATHPDQLSGDDEKRETFLGVYRARRDVLNNVRAIDVARAYAHERGELPIWATDLPIDPTGNRSTEGVKYFHVASYAAWAQHYGDLPPQMRSSYEIVRVMPTRFYMDIDVDRRENPALTDEVFFRLRAELVQAVREEFRHVTQRGDDDSALDEVVVLDSTRPHKISQHLVFPNAVLRNPFHCGALLRRVQVRLLRRHEPAPGAGDSNGDHPFFIWARNKDRAAAGETVRVRNFFVDLKVYTRDRNFRLYGSRKNIAGALPLVEAGNTTGAFSWDIFNKTLLQRVPRSVPVADCMELDGSLPVSTNNANLHRYDIATSGGNAQGAAAAAVPPAAPAPPTAAAVAATAQLVSYWSNVFPFDVLWHLAPPGTAAAREFCFVFPKNVWTPACFFRTAADLRAAAVQRCPAQIHVGLVRAPVVAAETETETLSSNPTLAFDVDVNDYAPFRPCCKDGNTACERCWPILEFAQIALTAFLREYGMDDVLFFFSGSKGVHAWVPPTNANAARVANSTRARCTLADDFASVYRRPLTPVGKEEEEEDAAAAESGAADDTRDTSEYTIPDFAAATHLREFTRTVVGSKSSRARWRKFVCEDMGLAAAVTRHERRHGTASALAHVLWPRIDAAVTCDPRHKIKAPYSVHARTGRVAVWLPNPAVNPFSAQHASLIDPAENVRALRLRLGLLSN